MSQSAQKGFKSCVTSKGPSSDLRCSMNLRFAIVRLMTSRTGSYGIIGENLRVEHWLTSTKG